MRTVSDTAMSLVALADAGQASDSPEAKTAVRRLTREEYSLAPDATASALVAIRRSGHALRAACGEFVFEGISRLLDAQIGDDGWPAPDAEPPVEVSCRRMTAQALEALQPSAVVTLNRAVAVWKLRGPEAALAMIEPIKGELDAYFYLHGLRGTLLKELGRRDWTNVLVEGGSALLGSFFDERQIDEFHVFIAPKILGGAQSPGAVGGAGLATVNLAAELRTLSVERLDGDVYINARRPPG